MTFKMDDGFSSPSPSGVDSFNVSSSAMVWSNGTVSVASQPVFFDAEQHVVKMLGPQRLPLNWLIPVTSVYSVIFLTGFVGNLCTCLVISRNQYMQTATNCYLFNLAIADMLTLLFAMPLELYTLWKQYPWELGKVGCFLRTVVPEATAYASILTIVTFSVERYIAICHPIHQQTKSKLSHAIRNIILIWMVSIGAALPYGIFSGINYIYTNQGLPIWESAWCGFPFNKADRSWESLMLVSTFFFFVVPISLIIVLYVRIALTLRQSRALHRCTSEGTSCRTDRERSKVQSRRVVVRMLVAVVIAFFVCWAPFHAQRLLFLYVSLYGDWTDTLRRVNQNLFSLAGSFYYFNSTVNPILYSVMSNRFRVAFREKLCAGPPSLWCICCCFFCCIKDFERRSQRATFYRNSNSHSSVRSYVSYPGNAQNKVNNNNNNNPTLPRTRSLVVDYNDKLGTAKTWVKQPDADELSGGSSPGKKFGNTLTVSPPSRHSRHSDSIASSRSSKSIEKKSINDSSSSGKDIIESEGEEKSELTEELDEAIRPELDKLTDSDKGCINCSNCTLLFPPKPTRNPLYLVDRTSCSELIQIENSGRQSPEIMESVV